MWPFRNKNQAAPAPEAARDSFFTTDGIGIPRDNPVKRARRMQELMKLTFRNTIDDMKPVDE